MIRLLTTVLLFASFGVVAEVTLTDINNNEVADAEEVMDNFNALKQGVEANATAIQNLDSSGGLTVSQLRGLITIVEETESCTDEGFYGCVATCPDDKIAIGGGCFLPINAPYSNVKIIRSGIVGEGYGLAGKAYLCEANEIDKVQKVQAVCL